MKHRTLLTCMCGLILFGSCKDQPTQNEQPLEVMTFNIRLDAPSDSANNWKYRKDNVCKMIAYYQPDLLGMQEVCHNQMEDLKLGLPQYTALGVYYPCMPMTIQRGNVSFRAEYYVFRKFSVRDIPKAVRERKKK